MPVTRASAQPSTRVPLTLHKTNAGAPEHPHEIIVLSSDDEPSSPKKPPMKRRRAKDSRRGQSAAPFAEDVVEIVSDDERPIASSSSAHLSTIAALQRQLKETQEEIERLKAEASAREKAPATGNAPLLNVLDDHVSCEICTLKMWTPATLLCGHTFCQSCLRDWFTAALVKRNAAHPQWQMREHAAAQLRAVLRDPNLHHYDRRETEVQIQMLLAQAPLPEYTCPSCRAPVKTKPTEVYALKAMVSDVAKAQGEIEPPKPVVQTLRRHRAQPGIQSPGPWDTFFQ